MNAQTTITPLSGSWQDKAKQLGFRIVPRRFVFELPFMNGFEGAASLTPEQQAMAHRKEELALMERVSQQPGNFVIYQPHADADGFVLVGDDRDQLAEQSVRYECDMVGISAT